MYLLPDGFMPHNIEVDWWAEVLSDSNCCVQVDDHVPPAARNKHCFTRTVKNLKLQWVQKQKHVTPQDKISFNKVMLHRTICNDDFYRKTALQCRNNVVTLCCAKNRCCESSSVTSPLRQERIMGDRERETPSLVLGTCECHQSYF